MAELAPAQLLLAVTPSHRNKCPPASRPLTGALSALQGQLTRACVELAKNWRMDKYLRRLDVRARVQRTHC